MAESSRAAHIGRVRGLPLSLLYKKLAAKGQQYWGLSVDESADLAERAIAKLVHGEPLDWDAVDDPDACRFLLVAMWEGLTAARADIDTARACESLKDRLATARLPLAVAELCMAHGELTTSEIAVRLGSDVDLVHEAQRRIGEEMQDIASSMKRGESTATS